MKSKPNGRPKSKEDRRNFSLCKAADAFLADEAARTGRTMTAIIEEALLALKRIPAKARDTVTSELRKGA